MTRKIKNYLENINVLMFISFLLMIGIYLLVFGKYKTINLILDEYLLVLVAIFLFFVNWKFKRKLISIEIIDFTKQSKISLKTTIGFFLIFQVIDYYYENGFIGMISQWFLYWIMGLITILLISIVNYYKNYAVVSKIRSL